MLQQHPWLKTRNLGGKAGSPLPSEVDGYLLICLVMRPHLVPDEVKVYLATKVLGYPSGDTSYN
jgi:hypothetical protein